MTALTLETPHGIARIHLRRVDEPRAALVLGHGAGGGVEAPDLVAATEAALDEGVSVGLIEQPYRVSGRRSSPRAEKLDAAWTAVVDHMRETELAGLPLIVGGRSAGARVACRTAETTGAVAVLCLAFPFQPPSRRTAKTTPESRPPEHDAVRGPTPVLQGEPDQFGRPPQGPGRDVITVPGNHSPKTDLESVKAAVTAWLPAVVAGAAPVATSG